MRNKIPSIVGIVLIVSIPFIFRLYVVGGGSMYPTLHDGELVVVDTVSHLGVAPRRGEILVFRNPHRALDGNRVAIDIKRVIGLPGETVHVRNDRVVISRACDAHGSPLAPRYEAIAPQDGPCQVTYASSTLIGGGAEHENTNEFDMFLGPRDYFVLGDDRRDSSDSRAFGAVQSGDIIGRVMIKLY